MSRGSTLNKDSTYIKKVGGRQMQILLAIMVGLLIFLVFSVYRFYWKYWFDRKVIKFNGKIIKFNGKITNQPECKIFKYNGQKYKLEAYHEESEQLMIGTKFSRSLVYLNDTLVLTVSRMQKLFIINRSIDVNFKYADGNIFKLIRFAKRVH